jgi:hypothetical protein
MSPPLPLDITKQFFKSTSKSATGNQSLIGEFQNDLRRRCAPGYATIMVNGIPAHASFNLIEIPDDALLTDVEVVAAGRWSTNTVAAWRRQPNHPLPWFLVAGKYIRYRAGDVKVLAGVLRQRRPRSPPKRRSDHPELPAETRASGARGRSLPP